MGYNLNPWFQFLFSVEGKAVMPDFFIFD